MKENEEDGGGYGEGREGFSRNGMGRVSAESVAEAAQLAVQGMAFEVVYYPRAGLADFVVKAETVEKSLNMFWTSGMRVKMGTETEDSSRMAWFQGTVSSVFVPHPDNAPWGTSPWRMLQVTWDEPEVLQNLKRVSPWQVEYIVPTLPFRSTFPPAKEHRVPQNTGLPTDGEGDLFFPVTGLNNSVIGNLNPLLMNCSSFPAGMQGARQEPFFVSSLANFNNETTHQTCSDIFFGNNITSKLKTVSAELDVGSKQFDNFSPDSQMSVHFFGNEPAGKQGCNSLTKVCSGSFQLFGAWIHVDDPMNSGSGIYDVGCAEDNGSKMCKETDYKNNSPDLSLTCPHAKLLDGLDVQCQRASAVEACSL